MKWIIGAVAFVVLCGPCNAEPESPRRNSPAYDECLARGHTEMACDAAMRVLKREHENICRQFAKDYPDDPFTLIEANCPKELWEAAKKP